MSKLTLKQKRFADEYIITGPYGVVYCVNNIINDKKYIGITTRTIDERFNEHCKANSIIGKAISKYGKNNFRIYQLDSADSKQSLFELEKYFINKYDTYKNGYNATIGGEGVVGDIFIDVLLDSNQKKFVNFVNKYNKNDIDVNNATAMIRLVLLNIAQVYLICDKKTDKRDSAKLLLKMKSPLLEQMLRLKLFNLEELRRWSQWRNIQSG
ncbi:hypothetical protein BI362_00845 [Streptococcus parauberis]|nr:hypothetical protein BI362_00845 [Streptococcus parauberis]QBX27676.1 homing endonuclease [Streptococcus phage Javan406]